MLQIDTKLTDLDLATLLRITPCMESVTVTTGFTRRVGPKSKNLSKRTGRTPLGKSNKQACKKNAVHEQGETFPQRRARLGREMAQEIAAYITQKVLASGGI